MIFAREISDPLTGLVKLLDAEVAKNNKKMAAFVVFLTEDAKAEAKIKEMAKEHNIKHVSLAIMKPQGPYKGAAAISPEADITIVLYTGKKVKVNNAFGKGAFTEAQVSQVIDSLPQILNK